MKYPPQLQTSLNSLTLFSLFGYVATFTKLFKSNPQYDEILKQLDIIEKQIDYLQSDMQYYFGKVLDAVGKAQC